LMGAAVRTSEPGAIAGTSVALGGLNIYVGGIDGTSGNTSVFKFDSSFNLLSSDGVLIDGNTVLSSLAIGLNGTVVGAGTSSGPTLAVVRFDSDGNLDSSFG